MVLWGERLAECGPRYLVRCFVAAIFLGAAAYGLLAVLPPMASQVAVAALPVVSMGIYLDQTRRRPRLPQQYLNVRVRARIPVPLVLVALFFGFSFGLMKGLMAPVGPSWIAVRDALNIVAIVAAAGAFYVTSVVYRMDFDHLTYQVALPLVAAGFLFLPLREPLSVVGTAVYQFGYQYFYLVLWAIWAVLAAREKLPAAWVCAWGLLAIQIGQLAGSLAADLGLGLIGHVVRGGHFRYADREPVRVQRPIRLDGLGLGATHGRRGACRGGAHSGGCLRRSVAPEPLDGSGDRCVLPARPRAQPRLHLQGARHQTELINLVEEERAEG